MLFSFMLEKYIVCNVYGLRSPSIESSGVLYIIPACTSSMQELIMCNDPPSAGRLVLGALTDVFL